MNRGRAAFQLGGRHIERQVKIIGRSVALGLLVPLLWLQWFSGEIKRVGQSRTKISTTGENVDEIYIYSCRALNYNVEIK